MLSVQSLWIFLRENNTVRELASLLSELSLYESEK